VAGSADCGGRARVGCPRVGWPGARARAGRLVSALRSASFAAHPCPGATAVGARRTPCRLDPHSLRTASCKSRLRRCCFGLAHARGRMPAGPGWGRLFCGLSLLGVPTLLGLGWPPAAWPLLAAAGTC